MRIVLGKDGKLYRNSATYASPTWNEVSNVKDLVINAEDAEADVTRRASGGFRETVGTIRELSVEFNMVWDKDDTDLAAISTAWKARAAVEFLVLDGPEDVAGSEGVRATMRVASFPRNEELENAMEVPVVLKPTPAENAPAYYTAT
jgi:hypothetical protein